MQPRYPIYIPSKGRWDKQFTSTHLSRMGVPHYVIVEKEQLALYEEHRTTHATLLVLDESYRDRHETLDDFGHDRSFGAGPARNMAWDHSIADGHAMHWDVDDNIRGFWRLNRNLKVRVEDGTIFRVMEAFVERYDNVALAGPEYWMFALNDTVYPPYYLNTRIYSCTLIRNDIPFRWRLRMNEDTDLSLRALKAGWCTVLFKTFIQNKESTQTMKGGYNTEFYAKEGTLWKSQMLVDAHPDVVKLVERYGRWHHEADYDVFKQQLRLRDGVELPEGVDNFGMVLERYDKETGVWRVIESPREIRR